MPELPEALRERTLEALEDADNAILPALIKALNAVFGRVLREMTDNVLLAAVSPDDFDGLVTDWDDQVDKVVAPVVAELYENSAQNAFRVLSPSDLLDFKVSDPAFAEFMATATKRIKDIGPETWSRVRDTLAEGIGNGETQRELQKRVREHLLVSRARAERIARTEARAARNGGAMAGARALKEYAPAFKQWIATLDGRTRHSHAGAEGQVRPLDEHFNVGGSSLDYPGDPAGAAEEVVNCRCRWIAVEAPDSPALSWEGRQMEVSALQEKSKRWEFQEVLGEAGQRGLIAPRTLVAPATGFAARVQNLVAGLGNLADAVPTNWTRLVKDPDTGSVSRTTSAWTDEKIHHAPGPKALEMEAKFRELGQTIHEEVESRLPALVAEAERPTWAMIDAAKAKAEEAVKAVYRAKGARFDELAQSMFGKHRNHLSTPEWSQVQKMVDADRALQEAQQAARALREKADSLRHLRLNGTQLDPLAARKAYREKLLEVLGEVRDYGGRDFSVDILVFESRMAGVARASAQALERAGNVYPTEWVEHSNRSGPINLIEVGDRGFHRPAGVMSDIAMSPSIPNSMDPTGWDSTAVHEVGHRFEMIRPHIKTMEWTFHNRRTFKGGVVRPGQQEAVRSLKARFGGSYKPNEMFREDEFLNPYIGKVYADSPSSAWESFTVGVQSLMADGYVDMAMDPEFRNLIIGLLAGG